MVFYCPGMAAPLNSLRKNDHQELVCIRAWLLAVPQAVSNQSGFTACGKMIQYLSIVKTSNSPNHPCRDGCANQKLSWTETVAQPPPAVVEDLKGKNTSGVSGEGMTSVAPTKVYRVSGFSLMSLTFVG